MEQGGKFEITEEQHVKNVKKGMPATDYLKKSSPLAKLAKKYGFKIQVEGRIQRVLIFTKKAGVKNEKNSQFYNSVDVMHDFMRLRKGTKKE